MSCASPQILHATTIALDGRGLIIFGASGSGKSSLALQLIALGADLVADDRTVVTLHDHVLRADPPDAICGQIEARGTGLLTLPFVTDIPIYLAVDMDNDERERLPYPHHIDLLGQTVPCLRRHDTPHFAPATLLYLQTMKRSSDDRPKS